MKHIDRTTSNRAQAELLRWGIALLGGLVFPSLASASSVSTRIPLALPITSLSLSGGGATPLHHYSFDGSAVVDSVGTADGSLIGGAIVTSSSLSLDGIDDYVQFGERLVPSSGDFSVAFFAQQHSLQTDYREIISQGNSLGPGFYIGHNPAHLMRVGDIWISTGIPYPGDGLMHHFAVTVDAVETHLYIDGSLAGSFVPIFLTGGGNTTRLGRQFDPFAEFFHGSIDELWIFNGALSAAEVAALANNPCAVPTVATEVGINSLPPNPVALWPSMTTRPLLGETWDPWIDHSSFATASSRDYLFVGLAPRHPVALGIGTIPFHGRVVGTLLCAPAAYRNPFRAVPGNSFQVPIPNDCALLGLNVCAQGGSLVPGPRLLLTNGLEITIGNL